MTLEGFLTAQRELEQRIHNLSNRFPCGILSVDDENDEKLKRLRVMLMELKVKARALKYLP